ncbi:MAG: hypothetical protein LBJ44_05885 [Propionibacteriaceae bacterium]|jgi:hypothetical protein|nr:hypothetical protein [Propionibacteriaceae bacterium]
MGPARPALALTPRRRRGWLVAVGLALVSALVLIWLVASRLGSETEPPLSQPPALFCRSIIGQQTAQLTPEQAANAALIAGVATQRGLAPRAVSIALTTAFQESGIRNLDYGDLDSLGLFQQRPAAGWGTPEQIMDPIYSTNKFYDAMVRVPNWADSDIGDVAQAVQISAYPDYYDKHVARARLLASALSGQTAAAWSCLVRDPAPADPAALTHELGRTYGGALRLIESTPADSERPAQLVFQATSPEAAWSAGAFAQSWAMATGVSRVQVGPMSWTAQPESLADWVDLADGSAPTRLQVTL